MSAIIAGKACKKCGKEYYLSLGHPRWYDDVVKRGKPKSDHYREWEEMKKSGKCPNCFIGDLIKPKIKVKVRRRA